MLSNCRSQFLLDRLGRCLKLFVSTDSTFCHEFASQLGLDIFVYAKNTQNYREYRIAHTTVYLNGAATAFNSGEKGALTLSWLGALTHRTATTRMAMVVGWCVRRCVCARVCVHACVMCLQNTIIIFCPG